MNKAQDSIKDIIPKVDSQFKINKALGGFIPGVVYKIIGFGYAKPKGVRTDFWKIVDKYNVQQRPKYMYKNDLNRLYKEGVIVDDFSNEEKITKL